MELIIRKLEIIKDCLKRLKEIEKENPTLHHYSNSWRSRDITERNLQKIIEAFIDIGKILISEKGLKEPSNNREVFMILAENALLKAEYLPAIEKMVGLRNILVHSYDRVDDTIVFGILKKNLKDIEDITDFFSKLIEQNEKSDRS